MFMVKCFTELLFVKYIESIYCILIIDCGINAHKHCKDQVIMECRSRTSVGCHCRSGSVCNGVKANNSNGKLSIIYLQLVM